MLRLFISATSQLSGYCGHRCDVSSSLADNTMSVGRALVRCHIDRRAVDAPYRYCGTLNVAAQLSTVTICSLPSIDGHTDQAARQIHSRGMLRSHDSSGEAVVDDQTWPPSNTITGRSSPPRGRGRLRDSVTSVFSVSWYLDLARCSLPCFHQFAGIPVAIGIRPLYVASPRTCSP